MRPLHVVTIIVLAAAIAIGSVRVFGPNNVIEEAAEAVIEEETGIEVDFTPEGK